MSCRRNTVLLFAAAYITSVTAVGLYDPRLLGDAGPAQGLDSLDGAIWSVGVRVKQEYVDVPATVPGFAPHTTPRLLLTCAPRHYTFPHWLL